MRALLLCKLDDIDFRLLVFFFISIIILKIYWQSKSALAINTGHELPHKNNNVLTELQYMRACSQQQHTHTSTYLLTHLETEIDLEKNVESKNVSKQFFLVL